jgi:hypothetical protein
MIWSPFARRTRLTGLVLLVAATPALAQHEHHVPPPPAGWAWAFDSSTYLTVNLQERRFRDFHQVESQNWLMGVGTRRIGPGTLIVHGMFSLEAFTLRDLGSSQVFQTGETFAGAPLIDYQHPHDLFMRLSIGYERPVGRTIAFVRGGPVDEPTLGPTAFMHRRTASLQPTAPLAHHQLDSTHITHGTIAGGIRVGSWELAASTFRGREPNEDRLDLELGALDSYALRAAWGRGDTRAQVSIGWLADPHTTEPGDVTRLTASLEHAGTVRDRPAAVTVAWGRNRDPFSAEQALLLEATLGLGRGTGYLRGEVADKHIIGAGGLHAPGTGHPHVISRIGLLMAGYTRTLWTRGPHGLHAGADISVYRVPAELTESYGHPMSMHLYTRWTVAVR